MVNEKVIDFVDFKNKNVATKDEYYYAPTRIDFYYLIKTQEMVINDNSLIFNEVPSPDKKVDKNKNKALLNLVNSVIKDFNKVLIINFGELYIVDDALVHEQFQQFVNKYLIKEGAQNSIFSATYDVQSSNLAITLLANTELFKEIKIRDAWALNNKLTGEAMSETFPYIFLYLFHSAKKHYENLIKLDDPID